MQQPEPTIDERIAKAQHALAVAMRTAGAPQHLYVVQTHEIQIAAFINTLLPTGSAERTAFLEQYAAGLEAAAEQLSRPRIQVA